MMNGDEAQECPLEPQWETLPPPVPVPLKKVLAYESPGQGSPDAIVLRLFSQWSSWMVTVWMTPWTVMMTTILWRPNVPIGLYLIPIPFICGVGYAWYRLLLPRRLRIDSEGLELSGVGLHPGVQAIPWAEIESLRLERRTRFQRAEALHLIVRPAQGSSLWSELDNVVDLSLGMTNFLKVDAALRACSPPKYWSAMSDTPSLRRRRR